jgi:hypothetical protein
MRRRRLKKLVKRLHELRQQKLTRDQLLIKLGAARGRPMFVAGCAGALLPACRGGRSPPSSR